MRHLRTGSIQFPLPLGGRHGGGSSAWERPAGDSPFGRAPLPGLAGYGSGLDPVGLRPHACGDSVAVQFRWVSGGGGAVAERIRIAVEPPSDVY